MMYKFALLALCLGLVNGVVYKRTSPDPQDISETLAARVAQGQVTLNEMFREVEKLMEDTQQKLEEAVQQMDNETARSMSNAHGLPLNYHNETSTMEILGNQTIHTIEKIDKETDNETGGVYFSRTWIQTSGQWNEADHECLIDEDCGKDSYCFYEILTSKCMPCKAGNMICTKDEECCGDQLCVWGMCAQNRTKGQSGTICQYQSDCSPQHCCAFHKALLFPVCRPRPQKRQPCQGHPNMLMELLLWDVEGPRENCPCTAGLQCLSVGKESLCMDEKSSVGEN
ncbi:dickkopf-related protein 3b [Chanos chanos]|uniref:Dickkopf-related protein 3b n=1 Tax=Chanos chanos TaxID=29144 RepID=A0A6J2WA31_CHACN|nr:dickkopf-related protein 3-like [Chanos chanos]